MCPRMLGLVFALTSLLFQSACQTAAPERAAAQRLDTFFTDLHERGLFDGAVVVAHRGRTVWQKGFGEADVERHVAFTPDTATDGASLAKTFTAALVVLLEREGRLNLDAPVQRLLPELPYADITLRHLLSHSAGLPGYDYFDGVLPAGEVRTTETLLAALAVNKPRPHFAAGSAFEYSSFGYDLAALAAARAAGKTYPQLLSERIFAPLGMGSAFARPGRFDDFPGVRTRAYRHGAAGKLEPNEVFDFEAFHGGSNLYMSASDLTRWNSSFFHGHFLQASDLSELQSYAHIGGHASHLTLGSWYRDREGTRFWYSGHLQGFHNEVFRDASSQWSLVYVSNNTLAPWLQKGLVRAMTALVEGRPVTLVKPATQDVEADERGSLRGQWRMSGGARITLVAIDGGLAVERDGVNYPMYPEGGKQAFYVPGLDWIVGFARGAEGSIKRIYVSSSLDEQWGVRAE